MVRIYAPEHYKVAAKDLLADNTKSELSLCVVPDGLVALDRKNRASAVLDQNNVFVPESMPRPHRKNKHIPVISNIHNIKNYDCDAIFCGGIDVHFGHFLLESLNRLWPVLDQTYSDAALVFVAKNGGDDGRPIPEFARQIIRLFAGAEREILFLTHDSARFRNLYIPQISFDIEEFVSPLQARVFARIAAAVPAMKHTTKFMCHA